MQQSQVQKRIKEITKNVDYGKKRKITAPKGCKIEKVELIDGAAVVTFKEKERKLPKSWKEFCENYPIKDGESYIDNISIISKPKKSQRRTDLDRNMLPDRATAEAVIALCQLIQLRNCYNGDWVPDWNCSHSEKFMIQFEEGKIEYNDLFSIATSFLYFKTRELRAEFLNNFRPLIEKLKPLYGII